MEMSESNMVNSPENAVLMESKLVRNLDLIKGVCTRNERGNVHGMVRLNNLPWDTDGFWETSVALVFQMFLLGALLTAFNSTWKVTLVSSSSWPFRNSLN